MKEKTRHGINVITSNGKYAGIMAVTEEEAYKNADIISETMINIKKLGKYNKGNWIWYFDADMTHVTGREIT